MSIPILRNVFPFPATSEYIFKFDVGGSSQQIVYNELEVRRNSDNELIYLQRIQSFLYQHTLPENTLTNGIQYNAKIRTYNLNQVLLAESSPIFFYCFSLPVLTIPTIVNGEVNEQSPVFEGTYTQAEGEELQSYVFYLYDSNQILLAQSPEIFSQTISYEFANLENRAVYYIELRVATVNEMTHTTGLIQFIPKYISPRFASAIELTNLPNEASILVSCNVIRIIGVADIDPPTYIDNEMIDLTDNRVVFDQGFSVKDEFILQIWLKNIVNDSVFFTLKAKDGSNIQLKYENNKINLYKFLDDDYILQYLIGEDEITPNNDIVFICVKHNQGLFDLQYEIISEEV